MLKRLIAATLYFHARFFARRSEGRRTDDYCWLLRQHSIALAYIQRQVFTLLRVCVCVCVCACVRVSVCVCVSLCVCVRARVSE